MPVMEWSERDICPICDNEIVYSVHRNVASGQTWRDQVSPCAFCLSVSTSSEQTSNQQQGSNPQRGAFAHRPRSRLLSGVHLLAVVLIAILAYLAVRPGSSSNVTYTISGSGVASKITYDTSAGVANESNVALPWQTTVEAGQVDRVSATAGYGTGPLSCVISSNKGQTLTAETAPGPSATVTCTHSAAQAPDHHQEPKDRL